MLDVATMEIQLKLPLAQTRKAMAIEDQVKPYVFKDEERNSKLLSQNSENPRGKLLYFQLFLLSIVNNC